MKKVLLTTAAVAALSTSAFADMLTENKFYLTAGVHGSKFGKVNNSTGAKAKSKWDVGMDVGAGYYFMDNLRTDIVYNHVFSPKFKYSDATLSSKVTVDAHAVMVRGFVDVADLGMAKVFVGAGLGWSQVKAKDTESVTAANPSPELTALNAAFPIPALNPHALVAVANGNSLTSKAKNKNNFAYSVHLGSAFEVAEGVNLDVAYSFRDYGKSKAFEAGRFVKGGTKTTLRSHNLSAAVRFDI